MRTEEEDFRFLAEYSPDVIARFTRDMVIRYVTPSSLSVLGWAPEELIGQTPSAYVIPEDMPGLMEIAERNGRCGTNTPATVRARKKNGTLIWIEINPHEMHDPVTGISEEAVVVMRDVTQRKLVEEKLAVLASTDGLTGLANRRAFDEALELEWKRTLREGTHLSLLLLDIDHFKGLNDRHGHQVGDDCLRAVAATVLQMVRATDTPARYGGEELAVILPLIDMNGAAETAERLRAAIQGLRLSNEANPEGGGVLTVSIGAATALARYGGTMRMPEGLLQAADNALYKAKSGGRNRVEGSLLIAPQAMPEA